MQSHYLATVAGLHARRILAAAIKRQEAAQ
jgi:hypothetical protein